MKKSSFYTYVEWIEENQAMVLKWAQAHRSAIDDIFKEIARLDLKKTDASKDFDAAAEKLVRLIDDNGLIKAPPASEKKFRGSGGGKMDTFRKFEMELFQEHIKIRLDGSRSGPDKEES